MNPTNCPLCIKPVNTFPVDRCGSFVIRLCLNHSKKENFTVDLNSAKKCDKCHEEFIGKSWARICPVCYWESKGRQISAPVKKIKLNNARYSQRLIKEGEKTNGN